jgi:3-oxoacyl-[acyl-carrier protein] reductase
MRVLNLSGHLASFLASEGAGFISGQVIYVAGGPKA